MIASLVRPALLSIRTFWKPFLLIQCCGIAIVLSYFFWDAFRQGADTVAGAKARWGMAIVIVASAFSGAAVPEIAKFVTGHFGIDRKRVADLLFGVGLFAILGIAGNYFYDLLGALWPDDGRLVTVLKKVAADQLVYTPFLNLPFISFVCVLRESRWSVPGAMRQLGPTWYLNRVGPLLVLCWSFWIPMTSLMYSLPGSLVFSFAMCAQAAWGLLMMSVASSGRLPASTPVTESTDAPLCATA